MSHRPLTNTSTLKITAAYTLYIYKFLAEFFPGLRRGFFSKALPALEYVFPLAVGFSKAELRFPFLFVVPQILFLSLLR
jgi:hypothetical protein